MTGQFTKNAPIVCGGKNDQDTLNTCFEYHPDKNRFKIQQKPRNVINRVITITDDFYFVIYSKWGFEMRSH